MKQIARLSDKNILEQANRIADLIQYADKISRSENPSSQLASALLYGNIAEYYCSSLLTWITLSINFALHSVRNDTDLVSAEEEDKTNLESTTRKLKLFNFPMKAEVLKNIKEIKDIRNELFHNLLTPKKEWNTSSLTKRLKTKTLTLIETINKIRGY